MYHNQSFQYEAGLPGVLCWVQPEYCQALKQFGTNYGYSMILAGDDLRKVAADVISGRFFHLLLGQEIGGIDYRDNTIATDGGKLITLLEHIFHPLNRERGAESFRIPSVLMRPWRPKHENFMTGGDYRAIFPPLWPNLDQALKAALQFGYGLPVNGPCLCQNPEAMSILKFSYDTEAIFQAETYAQLLEAMRPRE